MIQVNLLQSRHFVHFNQDLTSTFNNKKPSSNKYLQHVQTQNSTGAIFLFHLPLKWTNIYHKLRKITHTLNIYEEDWGVHYCCKRRLCKQQQYNNNHHHNTYSHINICFFYAKANKLPPTTTSFAHIQETFIVFSCKCNVCTWALWL